MSALIMLKTPSNNATLPLDRRPENSMIIFDDCSFNFHYVVEFDARNTV